MSRRPLSVSTGTANCYPQERMVLLSFVLLRLTTNRHKIARSNGRGKPIHNPSNRPCQEKFFVINRKRPASTEMGLSFTVLRMH
jgi:hypothetical protein